MKSSLKKLRGFALHKSDEKERNTRQPQAQLDELVQASQDMKDMRNCYDSLLSAAAAAANSAYVFSEALQEMGSCLLAKTSLNDDEENGKVLSKLGKLQFELQKHVDCYRTHIIQTITTPSESLLKELQIVEEMKRQCDDKRDAYKFMLAAQKEKGRSKYVKSETISSHQLQTAQQDYEDEATFFVFRLKSLKQGQSRSLLTQAARHYAAQLHFFRKGLKSLEFIEPYVKLVAEQQHIDYQFSGLEHSDSDDNDEDDDDGFGGSDGPIFDYSQNDNGKDGIPISRNSMEVGVGVGAKCRNENGLKLDQVDHKVSSAATIEHAQDNTDESQADLLISNRRPKPGSQSAPIFLENKFDLSKKLEEMQSSTTRKFHTYALPMPGDGKSSYFTSPSKPVSKAQAKNVDGLPMHGRHSSPLEANKSVNDFKEDLLNDGRAAKAESILKESNTNSGPIKLPPPLTELSVPQSSSQSVSTTKKIKRQAFCGPITSKAWSVKPRSSPADSIHSVENPAAISERPVRSPIHLPPVSPKMSLSTSPPPLPSPRINELHELPRPPVFSGRSSKPSSLVAHSAPLVSRGQEHQTSSKISSVAPQTATPLPTPPMVMARSLSIPSSGQRTTMPTTKLLAPPHTQERTVEVVSQALENISLSSIQPASMT